jgi:threonyl-tRNA synthetase
MSDAFINQHKAKHLLAHVLAAAAAKRWPEAIRGRSGETSTGFFADLGLAGLPAPEEMEALIDDMARLLRDVQVFREVELSPADALAAQAGQPWKSHHIEAIAESDSRIRCLELDGFIDVCDCALKAPAELRALHPEKFQLTGAHPMVWTHRGRDQFLIRIKGELFPAVTPCACCAP